jgi:hypothetical protein
MTGLKILAIIFAYVAGLLFFINLDITDKIFTWMLYHITHQDVEIFSGVLAIACFIADQIKRHAQSNLRG